jgi:hypothetical protein
MRNKKEKMRLLALVMAVVQVLFLTMACGEGVSNGSSNTFDQGVALMAPPEGAHWVVLQDEGIGKIVFSRTVEDEGDNPLVRGYLVCVENDKCEQVNTNYLDLPLDEARSSNYEARVYALDDTGNVSPASNTALFSDYDIGPDMANNMLINAALPPAAPTPTCNATAPTSVFSPVFGSLTVIGSSASTNQTTKDWSFWQHKSGYHRPGGGYPGADGKSPADDTYAWDINLNVSGANSNLDVGMPFYAAGWGKVTDVNSNNSFRVDHCGWRSAYLHASTLFVRNGDYVTPTVRCGLIGRRGMRPEDNPNDHLHWVTYFNASGNPVSYNPGIIRNTVTISITGPSTISRGQSATLSATASLYHGSGICLASVINLNSTAMNANTWWKSSNTSLVKVDGSGKITAVARGTATISLYYSGEMKTFNVVVN